MSHFISKNMEILDHKIDRMVPMPESPFTFRDDESFRNLVESIRLSMKRKCCCGSKLCCAERRSPASEKS